MILLNVALFSLSFFLSPDSFLGYETNERKETKNNKRNQDNKTHTCQQKEPEMPPSALVVFLKVDLKNQDVKAKKRKNAGCFRSMDGLPNWLFFLLTFLVIGTVYSVIVASLAYWCPKPLIEL